MAPTRAESSRLAGILYSLEDRPPWYLCLFLAFQQFLTCFGGMIAFPAIVSSPLCLEGDGEGKGQLMSTAIFVSGFSTILQSTFGTRLPIVQSVSSTFIVPIVVVMSLKTSNCPYSHPDIYNQTTLPALGSEGHKEIWQDNFTQIAGSLMVASVLQIVIGFTGFIGLMLRFIGPLTIAPTIMLIALGLFKVAADKGSTQWYICFTTIFLMVLFSQYLRNVAIPFPCMPERLKIFALFSVLISIAIAWVICIILTEADVLTDDPDGWGYLARTDIHGDTLADADWFRIPYPGQFGSLSVSVGAVMGCMAATLASIIESVGDYYACARLAGAPPPPPSALNRGIGMEGIACLLSGAWGLMAGMTSYSQNVGAIGITKVGSRIVIQMAGLLMVVLGCLGKFGALFATIPEPVVGGLFYIMFGMVGAVGVSNLQFVDLNSPRNLFVFGVSLFLGLSVPNWVLTHSDAIDTGSSIADQVLQVLSGTGMFVGGLTAFVLDNTIPGTKEERGLIGWNKIEASDKDDLSCYDLPFIQPFLNRVACFRYLPFCPGSVMDRRPSMDEDMSLPQTFHKDLGETNRGYSKDSSEEGALGGQNGSDVNTRI